MTPTGYLGPNWKSQVSKSLPELVFDGVLGDDPSHGIMLVTDEHNTTYVMIPAEKFDGVLRSCGDIQKIWTDKYPQIANKSSTHNRVT